MTPDNGTEPDRIWRRPSYFWFLCVLPKNPFNSLQLLSQRAFWLKTVPGIIAYSTTKVIVFLATSSSTEIACDA